MCVKSLYDFFKNTSIDLNYKRLHILVAFSVMSLLDCSITKCPLSWLPPAENAEYLVAPCDYEKKCPLAWLPRDENNEDLVALCDYERIISVIANKLDAPVPEIEVTPAFPAVMIPRLEIGRFVRMPVSAYSALNTPSTTETRRDAIHQGHPILKMKPVPMIKSFVRVFDSLESHQTVKRFRVAWGAAISDIKRQPRPLRDYGASIWGAAISDIKGQPRPLRDYGASIWGLE